MSMNGQTAVVEPAATPSLDALQQQVHQLQAQVDALRAQAPDNASNPTETLTVRVSYDHDRR